MKTAIYLLFFAITFLFPLSILAFGNMGNIIFQLIFFIAIGGYLYLIYLVIKKKKNS